MKKLQLILTIPLIIWGIWEAAAIINNEPLPNYSHTAFIVYLIIALGLVEWARKKRASN